MLKLTRRVSVSTKRLLTKAPFAGRHAQNHRLSRACFEEKPRTKILSAPAADLPRDAPFPCAFCPVISSGSAIVSVNTTFQVRVKMHCSKVTPYLLAHCRLVFVLMLLTSDKGLKSVKFLNQLFVENTLFSRPTGHKVGNKRTGKQYGKAVLLFPDIENHSKKPKN